jgi:hypothetical protein
MALSARWRAKVDAAVERGKREIAADIAAGVVPADVTDFAYLHDHVDANEYGGLCEDGWIEGDAAGDMSEDTQEAANRVQAELHGWLKGGRQ